MSQSQERPRKRSSRKVKRRSSSEPSEGSVRSNKKFKVDDSDLTTKGFQRHFAKHDYHDHALVSPVATDIDRVTATRGGVHNPFPFVLHDMMEQAESRGYDHLVSWQSHGRAFLIHQPKEFVKKVLPLFFKHTKISSFQRQLSLYGFVRLTHDGPDRGAYYHECFLRGRPFLLPNIHRTRVKGTWVRTSSSPESEPDFYKMDPVLPSLDQQAAAPAKKDDSDGNTTDESTGSYPQGQPPMAPLSCGSRTADAVGTMVYKKWEPCDGKSESNRNLKIHPFLQEALMTSSVLNNRTESTERVTSSRLMTTGPPVEFLDSSRRHPVIQPPQEDAALQPPPAFPTSIVAAESGESMSTDWTFGPQQSNLPSTQYYQQQIDSALTVAADDDDLATFLTGIDLDTDLFADLESEPTVMAV